MLSILDHFLRSLKSDPSSNEADDNHFIRALRSSHFLRALRASYGSHDLQRILRSDPSMVMMNDKPDTEDEEFARKLRTNGDHFLRSLKSSDQHFLRSLRSAHDFMRMVRSSDHFLRSLRDVNAGEPNAEQ